MSRAIMATEIDESLEAGTGEAIQALKPSDFHYLPNADDKVSGNSRRTVATGD